MAEWLKAHAWKACKRETVSRVRIPLSPPFFAILHNSQYVNIIIWSSDGRQHMKNFFALLIVVSLFPTNGFSQIIFKNCNLSPNFGLVDVIVRFEDMLIRTENKTDKNNVNLFEIIEHSKNGTLIVASNWVGTTLGGGETKEERDRILKIRNSLVYERIKIDLQRGEISHFFTVNDDAPEAFKELYRDTKKYVSTICGVENNYEKLDMSKKEYKTKENKKGFWKAFGEVLAENGPELFNAAVDAYFGTSGQLQNTGKRTHCRSTNVGGVIQVFCREY